MNDNGQTSEPATTDTNLVDANNDDDDEELIEPLSGNPFFHVTLSKTCIRPYYRLVVPVEGGNILPIKNVQTTLIRGQKSWEVTYIGKGTHKRFDVPGWTQFVVANSLKEGDVCVFELMEHTDAAMTLKVQVLRGDFPSGLQEKKNDSTENPIVVE